MTYPARNSERGVLLDTRDYRRLRQRGLNLAVYGERISEHGCYNLHHVVVTNGGFGGYGLHRVLFRLRSDEGVWFRNGDQLDYRRKNIERVSLAEIRSRRKRDPLKHCRRLLRDVRVMLRAM